MASRRGAAPIVRNFQTRNGGWSASLPTTPTGSWSRPRPRSGETYAEVAHEAIFRRWDKLRQWIAAEREFLAWRSGLEAARRAWQATTDRSKNNALLMGLALAQAQNWLAKRSGVLAAEDRNFISLSRKVARRRQLRVQALVGVLAAGVIAGMAAWVEHDSLNEFWRSVTVTRPFANANIAPYALTAAAEQALKPKDSFRECGPKKQDKDYCPDMVVVPAGSFLMGSPATEKGRFDDEGPQHTVTIDKAFAVSKFELTFAEWDTCFSYGDCTSRPPDVSWGRGQRPVIYVSLDDAQQYVAWLSKMTGKPYRLLTEAEYEYATRAGTTTAYPGATTSARTMPIAIAAAANGTTSRRRRSGRSLPTRSASTTWWAMSSSGWRIATTTAITKHRRTEQPGSAALAPASVSSAAVPGSALQKSSAQRSAMGQLLISGSTISVFGLPGRF